MTMHTQTMTEKQEERRSGVTATRRMSEERIESMPAPFSMPDLQRPFFPDRTFTLRDYGAIPGGTHKNTGAIRDAVSACSAAGGGTVVVPEGVWLTGAVHLQSNVNLHLERGAVLRFSDDPADYLPVVFTRWAGVECYNYSPLIYARDCENIALTGEGTLDGNGLRWWRWQKHFNRNEISAHLTNIQLESRGVPVGERVYGTEAAGLRPQFIAPLNCRNLLIEGLTITSGPFWTFDLTYCENVIVRRIKVETHGPNNDGLNIDSSRNVLIEHCEFNTGDDAVCLKSGMNEDGRRVNLPTENVVMRHCRVTGGHSGIVVGSEMSGGARNLYVHDCDFTEVDVGIHLKSVRGRGGLVEKMWFERVNMGRIRKDAIKITTDYPTATKPEKDAGAAGWPAFRDLCFRTISCRQVEGRVLCLEGLAEQPLRRLHFEDLTAFCTGRWPLRMDHCEAVSFVQCELFSK